jgi:hypothetical protein
MSRDDVTTVPSEDSRYLPPWGESIKKKYPRHRSCARVVVAIGVVLFALWNFSILARVVPAEVHQRKVDTVMLDSYLAEAESTANSETVTSDIASVVASSAAPTLSSKAYNNIEHTKRVEKEPRSESVSLSLVDNHRQ